MKPEIRSKIQKRFDEYCSIPENDKESCLLDGYVDGLNDMKGIEKGVHFPPYTKIKKRFRKYCLDHREHIDVLMKGYLNALHDAGVIDNVEGFNVSIQKWIKEYVA